MINKIFYRRVKSIFSMLPSYTLYRIRVFVVDTLFYFFQRKINPETIKNHDTLLNWAKDNYRGKIHNEALSENIDIINLKHKYLNYFQHKKLVFFIQLPASAESPGNSSLFGNLIETIQYMGIQVFPFRKFKDLENLFAHQVPNLILADDYTMYMKDWDWEKLRNLRKMHAFSIGLTATGSSNINTPLRVRLLLAKKSGVDFYYSFRKQAYLNYHEDYKLYHDFNYPIVSVPFGANILKFKPIKSNLEKDLDYIFIGSCNEAEYIKHFSDIFKNYYGFIGGPRWAHSEWIDSRLHSWLYARAKVGLNIHGPGGQKQWNFEVNERTYNLAAVGIPQIVDNPPFLHSIFGPDEIFVAGSPREYNSLFGYILKNPNIASDYANKAQKSVLLSHTTFHRIENFINEISELLESSNVAFSSTPQKLDSELIKVRG